MTAIPLIVSFGLLLAAGVAFGRVYILGDDWLLMSGRLSVVEVIPSYITLILNVCYALLSDCT
jgi:hypothetical protein